MKLPIVFALAASLYGQRILYNQDLDKKGQEAAAASKKIMSDPLTSKELQNLKVIEKQQIDGTLKSGYLNMRTTIESFDTWARVSRSVCLTLRQLYAADGEKALAIAGERANHDEFDKTCTVAALADQKKDVVKRKTAETKQSLEKRNLRAMATLGQDLSIQYSIRSLAADIQRHVKEEKAKIRPLTDQQISQKSQERAKMQKLASKKTAAAKPSSADTPGEGSMEVSASAKALTDAALDRLGNVKELLNAADSLGIKPPAGAEDALAKIEDGLKQIDALIGSVQSILNTYADIDVDPRSLIPSNEKLAASLLALEAERIKELAAIRAANALYLADLQIRLEYCVSLLDRMGLWLSNNSVESTLTASTNSELRYNAIYCLHLAAAGAAVNQTPFATEGLRESIAQRRYGIRRDGVYNGAYEQALQASAQRLSAYYAAGITKTQIAQLLYYLSGLVSLPKIAF